MLYLLKVCWVCACACTGVLATFLVCVYYIVYIANNLGHRVSFMVFFLGAIFCMGASAVYHAFICHSETICKLLAKYVQFPYFRFSLQYNRLLVSYCRLSVCLSVMLCIVAKRYISEQKCLNSEQVNRKSPRERDFQLSTPYTNPVPSTLYLLHHGCGYHLASKLKPYCEQANRQNSHVWNSHHQHVARLFLTTPYDRLVLGNSWASC